MVFGGGAHHGGAANVDLLNTGVKVSARGNRVSEGVKVNHHQVNGSYLQFTQLGQVGILAAVSQNTGVNLGVQGLNAAF